VFVTTKTGARSTRTATARTAAHDDDAPALSGVQLGELLRLIKGSDSVELKLSVPDADRRSAVRSLGMDPLNAQIRQVVFFDTPDLQLSKHGIVVRARRIQGKPGDAIVKLRPVEPDALSPALRKAPGFGVEVDALPGGFVCSAAMKVEVPDDKVLRVLGRRRSISRLFTKQQRSLFVAHAPDGIELDHLGILGPVNVLKLKFTPSDFTRRLVAELWFYPDGSRILELSTKCPPADAFAAAAEAKAYLAAHGIDLAAPQQTKTRSALEFFSKELLDGEGQ
jgi:hypothetical protein